MTSPLAPEVLVYDLTPASDPQVAPDGSRLIYTLSTTERPADGKPARTTSQIWLCGLDGGDARQLTRSGDRNGGGRWSPDGTAIAFVSDRPALGGTGQGRTGRGAGLYVLALDRPGEAREITRHAGRIGDLAW